ncbi:MAG: lmo0937 family membrane protein [Salibacteraceae bacterium]
MIISLKRSALFFAQMFIVAALLLSSCNEGLNSPITKRQHRKGYDLNFAHKAKPARAIDTKKQEEHKPKAIEKTESTAERNPSLFASSEEDLSQFVIPAEKPSTTFTPLNVVKKLASDRPVMKEVVKPIFKAKSKPYGNDSSESDARSFLWLVIVILLILWLLGFLSGGFGVGGLIHLLLIIALILFILWMLKII